MRVTSTGKVRSPAGRRMSVANKTPSLIATISLRTTTGLASLVVESFSPADMAADRQTSQRQSGIVSVWLVHSWHRCSLLGHPMKGTCNDSADPRTSPESRQRALHIGSIRLHFGLLDFESVQDGSGEQPFPHWSARSRFVEQIRGIFR